MPRHLTPADTFAFTSAADAQISPSGSGSAIAYLHTTRPRSTDTRHTVLMLSTDRKTWTEIPDSTRLAFLRAGTTLAVHTLATGQTQTLLTAKTALRELAWSPDGKALAYQQREITPAPTWLGLTTPETESWAAPQNSPTA